MNDKFKVNIRIALPIAIITGIIYVLVGSGIDSNYTAGAIEWTKVVPYLVVLVAAICGVNVMLVLFIGILLSGIVGIADGRFRHMGLDSFDGTRYNQYG